MKGNFVFVVIIPMLGLTKVPFGDYFFHFFHGSQANPGKSKYFCLFLTPFWETLSGSRSIFVEKV